AGSTVGINVRTNHLAERVRAVRNGSHAIKSIGLAKQATIVGISSGAHSDNRTVAAHAQRLQNAAGAVEKVGNRDSEPGRTDLVFGRVIKVLSENAVTIRFDVQTA